MTGTNRFMDPWTLRATVDNIPSISNGHVAKRMFLETVVFKAHTNLWNTPINGRDMSDGVMVGPSGLVNIR